MAETKAEAKVTKVDVKSMSTESEGLITSWVSHGAELAERTTTTCFDIARDVRGDLNQRLLSALNFVEGSQQSLFKLVRGIDERVDRLAADVLDSAESVTVGLIRALRDTGYNMTSMAGGLARPREISRAA